MKTSTILILVTILLSCIVLVMCGCRKDSTPSHQSSSGKKSVHVKYFYSPYCPHCRNFMGAWDDFTKSQNDFSFEKIDCSTRPDECRGIRGVPHVLFVKDGKEEVYSGDRSVQSLREFLKLY